MEGVESVCNWDACKLRYRLWLLWCEQVKNVERGTCQDVIDIILRRVTEVHQDEQQQQQQTRQG